MTANLGVMEAKRASQEQMRAKIRAGLEEMEASESDGALRRGATHKSHARAYRHIVPGFEGST
jgi:hypothetical protein